MTIAGVVPTNWAMMRGNASCRTCRYLRENSTCGAIGNGGQHTTPDRWCTDWCGDTPHAAVMPVMTGRCETCKWWGARKAVYRLDDDENECALLSYDGRLEERRRCPLAHIASYEGGALITLADFGCMAHEPGTVTL